MKKEIYRARAFLFDFDGTLVDSMPAWGRAMLAVLDRHGIAYPENIIKIITPLGNRGTAEYFQQMGLRASVPEIVAEIDRELTPMYTDRILAKDGVADCLDAMKKAGKTLAVLTASPHRWLDPCLARNRLTRYFDFVWSCEDFPTIKTDPAIYRDAAGRLGVRLEEMTFLDDNLRADLAAAESGCGVIGVYDDSGRESEADIRRAADGYIYHFEELKRQVLGGAF